jgi:hypothetical protein
MIKISAYDVVILLTSLLGLVLMLWILFQLINQKTAEPAQIHVNHPLAERIIAPDQPIEPEEAVVEDLAERIRFERIVARENAGDEPRSDEKMTKKMLMKAEKKRLKAQRRMDMAAHVQAKMERDRLKEEKYLERYGPEDSDTSDDETEEVCRTKSSKPKIITDYHYYVGIFPQILDYLRSLKLIRVSEMQTIFSIQNSILCIEIIQYFETSGFIQGIFLEENSVYCRFTMEELHAIAASLSDRKVFSLEDVTSTCRQMISTA